MDDDEQAIECQECEAYYHVVYNEREQSTGPKFCPFCGSEVESEDE